MVRDHRWQAGRWQGSWYQRAASRWRKLAGRARAPEQRRPRLVLVADAGAREGGHVLVQAQGGLGEHHGEGGATPLPQPHVQVEQRARAEPVEDLAVGALGRRMREQAVVDGVRIDRVRDGGSRGCDEAVDDHRSVLLTGGDYGAEHSGELAAAEAREIAAM